MVDWHEVWTRASRNEYLGRAGGFAGHLVQLACLRIPQRAFCFSRLHRDRLLEEGVRGGRPEILEGEYAGDLTPPEPNEAQPLVDTVASLLDLIGNLD